MGLECEEECQVAYCVIFYEELMHDLNSSLKEEKLREAEFRQRTMMEEGFHLCEPEKGSFLGEDDDGYVEGRPVESLMICQESLEHHVGMMSEASNETMESCVFKTNDLCVFIGCAKDEVGKSSDTFIKIVEGRYILSKGIEHNQNYVMKKDDILLSHKNSHGKYYTQLINEEADDGNLMKCSDQHKEMIPDETQESHGFAINHCCVYVGYEDNHKENEVIEKQHSKIMLRDCDEELRLLEEWLINPRIDEDFIVVAGTNSSMIHDINDGFKASRGEEELLVFQTNCLSEYVKFR
jgi:hypothetical protein